MLAFKPPADATSRAKVLLIGSAGVGKTHAALTFPKPAVIDAEGSIGWFKDRFKFDAVPTKSYTDVRDLVRQVRSNPHGYETIVIDSLTTIYNGLINVASQGQEDLRPLDWGRIKRKFSQLLDELYYQLPMHVVCIGWIKAEYAKAGTIVGGKTVKGNDMIVVGEQFDGDKKTEHAFDFIFKIEGNDGKRTRATVLKSRSGQFAKGSVIENFSWETLAPLFNGRTETAKRGMTDEEQASHDSEALVDQLPTGPQILARAKAQGIAQDGKSFWDWAVVSANVERGKLDEFSKRAILRALADAKPQTERLDAIEDAPILEIPPSLTLAAEMLGIMPRGIQEDLRKFGGDAEKLEAHYVERSAHRTAARPIEVASTPPPPVPPQTLTPQEQEAEDLLNEIAKPKSETPDKQYASADQIRATIIAFNKESAKALFPAREDRHGFAVQTIGRQIASFNDLTADECEAITRALNAAVSAGAPVNNASITCPACGAEPGMQHFQDCELS